jgi:predicted PurR-regulated permease PerM
MKSETFQRGFLLLLLGGVTFLFFSMIRDYMETLLFAAIFSSLVRPWYLRLVSLTRGRRRLSSGLTLTAFVLLIILPLSGFVGIVANQALRVTQNVKPWIQDNLSTREDLNHNLKRLPGYKYIAPYREPIIQKVSGTVSGLGAFIFERASSLTTGTVVLLVNFAIMLYAMFFFLIDGPEILDKILYYTPLQSRDENRLLDGFRSMARATIKGLVVIGAAQGALAGLALWAAGVPSALFWGTVMAALSILPNIGAALVWAPACVYIFIQGRTTAAVLVFLWCALVVSSVDNFLRPVLVGKDTQVNELLIFISTLGGMTVLGLEGFLLGPVLALIFLTVWDIYGATFRDVLPGTDGVKEGG